MKPIRCLYFRLTEDKAKRKNLFRVMHAGFTETRNVEKMASLSLCGFMRKRGRKNAVVCLHVKSMGQRVVVKCLVRGFIAAP